MHLATIINSQLEGIISVILVNTVHGNIRNKYSGTPGAYSLALLKMITYLDIGHVPHRVVILKLIGYISPDVTMLVNDIVAIFNNETETKELLLKLFVHDVMNL